ncbi:hypothetical protein ABZ738_05630 [Micromonospora sp. NPDC047793]|uniref:hypothetical protein n=1 Tax=Micromonospora sp. NPDC047793 TaxID=3154342 RepID=UPI003400FC5D
MIAAVLAVALAAAVAWALVERRTARQHAARSIRYAARSARQAARIRTRQRQLRHKAHRLEELRDELDITTAAIARMRRCAQRQIDATTPRPSMAEQMYAWLAEVPTTHDREYGA